MDEEGDPNDLLSLLRDMPDPSPQAVAAEAADRVAPLTRRDAERDRWQSMVVVEGTPWYEGPRGIVDLRRLLDSWIPADKLDIMYTSCKRVLTAGDGTWQFE